MPGLVAKSKKYSLIDVLPQTLLATLRLDKKHEIECDFSIFKPANQSPEFFYLVRGCSS